MLLASLFYILLALFALAVIHKRRQSLQSPKKTYSRAFILAQKPTVSEVPKNFLDIDCFKRPRLSELQAKRQSRFAGRSKGQSLEDHLSSQWVAFGSFAEMETYGDVGTRENSFIASPVAHELDMSSFDVKSVFEVTPSLNVNAPEWLPQPKLGQGWVSQPKLTQDWGSQPNLSQDWVSQPKLSQDCEPQLNPEVAEFVPRGSRSV
jgi:hypothetical protein